MASLIRKGKNLIDGKEPYDTNLVASIQKALSKEEIPTKIKHVRSVIISTHHEQGGSTFWAVVTKIPLQSQGPTCWKFCHTLHKLLRDGHVGFIPDCMKYITWLDDLGKVWGHLPENFGPINSHYLKLLTNRLKFHKKHLKIPGNLVISDDVLAEVTGRDANGYFEFGCELLDLMDDCMNLQAMVFHQLERSRDNSMTITGQCRLYPLILVIQDSCQIYDYLVKILFKLHKAIPADALEGHRERFLGQFKTAKQFYEQCGSLQYFKGLIQVPLLPDQAPNFLIASELFKHKKPVARVVGEDDDEPEAPALPSREAVVTPLVVTAPVSQPSIPEPDVRDSIISQLRAENESLKNDIEYIKLKAREKIQELTGMIETLRGELSTRELAGDSMRSQITSLKTQMNDYKMETEALRENVTQLERAAAAAALLSKAEEHARSSDDRFKKMKDVYENLKQEHVTLLRTQAQVKKQLANELSTREQTEQTLQDLKQQHESLKSDKSAGEESLNKTIEDNSEQMNRFQERITQLETQKQEYEEKLIDSEAERTNLKTQVNNYETTHAELERDLRTERDDKQQASTSAEQEITDVKSQLSEVQLNAATLDKRNQELMDELEAIKTSKTSLESELTEKFNKLQSQLDDLNTTTSQRAADDNVEKERLQSELDKISSELTAQINKNRNTDQSQREALDSALERGITEINTTQEFIMSEDFITHTASADAAVSDLRRLDEDLDLLTTCIANSEPDIKLTQQVNNLTHRITRTLEESKAACNRAPPDQGEELSDNCVKLGNNSVGLFSMMRDEYSRDSIDKNRLSDKISLVKSDISAMLSIARGLTLKSDQDIDIHELSEMVEDELEATQKAIAEGAEKIQAMLETARQRDTGVKLEVNEKILDSVTGLMAKIQELVRKSKILQDEIVTSGRGSASAKEFYMKNHRWTEGLVSAAKAVGWGAKTLVEGAEKIVEGKGSLNELKVYSNEIAASTAQLVVSSQVKSKKDSQKLAELKLSARAVKSATAEVVASSNFGQQMIDDADLLDFDKLSLIAIKRQEMNCQVHLLELESNVEKERKKLVAIRKRHYQIAGESEGWENILKDESE